MFICFALHNNILKNEVYLILPKLPEGRKSKRGTFSPIISGFVGLAFEGILSFLHNKRHKVLLKAISAMSIKTDIQRNKLMNSENILGMYGVYRAEMLERLIKQCTHYIADKQCMKAYLQEGHLQHMNTIHKCMVNEVNNIVQLIQYYT